MTERQKDVVASYFYALLHEDKTVPTDDEPAAHHDETPVAYNKEEARPEDKPEESPVPPEPQLHPSTERDKKEHFTPKNTGKKAFSAKDQPLEKSFSALKNQRQVAQSEPDLNALQRQKLEALLKPQLQVQKEVLTGETEAKPVAVDLKPLPVKHKPVIPSSERNANLETAKKTTPDLDVSNDAVVACESEAILNARLNVEWTANGRPVWAQGRFDVLLFEVAGLTLAVPLVTLGHIHPITEDLTPLFGQADWFMGLQPSPSGQVRCVNTALFVMPERYDASFIETAKYVISIDGMDWGLAVDTVQQPTSLNPDDVTWRTERSKRPWLAGTVKAAMCALIDVPRMGSILQSSDPNRSKAH